MPGRGRAGSFKTALGEEVCDGFGIDGNQIGFEPDIRLDALPDDGSADWQKLEARCGRDRSGREAGN
jgi:hypothetical protein